MRPLVIANPAAGRGRTGRDLASLVRAVRGAVGELDVAETRRRGDAPALAVAAARDRRPLVVGLGGDGTLDEIVNGLLVGSRRHWRRTPRPASSPRSASSARAPAATTAARSASRTSSARTSPPSQAAPSAPWTSAGRASLISTAGRWSGTGSTCSRPASAAWSTGTRRPRRRSSAAASPTRRPRSAPSSSAGAVKLVCSYVDPDGERRELPLDAHAVAICNGRTFGGGMNIAPMAKLDDGLLEVIVFQTTTRWRLVATSHDRVRRHAPPGARRGPLHLPGAGTAAGEPADGTPAARRPLPARRRRRRARRRAGRRRRRARGAARARARHSRLTVPPAGSAAGASGPAGSRRRLMERRRLRPALTATGAGCRRPSCCVWSPAAARPAVSPPDERPAPVAAPATRRVPPDSRTPCERARPLEPAPLAPSPPRGWPPTARDRPPRRGGSARCELTVRRRRRSRLPARAARSPARAPAAARPACGSARAGRRVRVLGGDARRCRRPRSPTSGERGDLDAGGGAERGEQAGPAGGCGRRRPLPRSRRGGRGGRRSRRPLRRAAPAGAPSPAGTAIAGRLRGRQRGAQAQLGRQRHLRQQQAETDGRRAPELDGAAAVRARPRVLEQLRPGTGSPRPTPAASALSALSQRPRSEPAPARKTRRKPARARESSTSAEPFVRPSTEAVSPTLRPCTSRSTSASCCRLGSSRSVVSTRRESSARSYSSTAAGASGAGLVHHGDRTALARAHVVEGRVDGHAVEPRGQVELGLVAGQAAEHLDQHLLRDVLRLFRIVDDPQREVVDRGGVGGVQSLERLALPARRPATSPASSAKPPGTVRLWLPRLDLRHHPL